jgi:hypothetical protein
MSPSRLIGQLHQDNDLRNALSGALVRIRNTLLYHRFHFAKWHITGTYYARPYHHRAVSMASALDLQLLVEIGAGLGEIVSRCPANRRVAFDSDTSVIRAANLLHRKNVKYYFGRFTDPGPILDRLHSTGEKQIDLLILVNWIHEIDFGQIRTTLQAIDKGCPIRRVLIDTINLAQLGYQFHHTIADLETIGNIEASIDGGDGVRKLHLISLAR